MGAPPDGIRLPSFAGRASRPGGASATAPSRPILILILALGLGVVVLALERSLRPLSTLSAQGGPWLVLGFLAGSLARRPLVGGIAGLAALVVATAAYDAAKAAVGSPLNPAEYDDRAFWFAAAVLAGGVSGIGGGVWASRGRWGRVVSVAVLSGAVLVEALWQVRGGPAWIALAAAAVALPLVLLRGHRERALGMVLALPIAGGLWLAADLILPVLLRLR